MYSLHYSDLGGGMGNDVARPFSSLDNGMGMEQQNEPMMKPQQNYLQRHEELLHGNEGNNQINGGSGSLSRNDELAVVRRPPDVNIRPQMTMDKLPQINAKQGEPNRMIKVERIDDREKVLENKKKQVAKTVYEKKEVFFNELFDVKGLMNIAKSLHLEKILLILFVMLIFAHVSYGYTLTLKRTILAGSFTCAFLIIYILYLMFKNTNFFINFIEEEKYQAYRPLLTIFVIALFTGLNVLIYKYLPMEKFKKFDFKFPTDEFKVSSMSGGATSSLYY